MKIIVIIFVILFSSTWLKAQEVDSENIFITVEKMPEFKGGQEALVKFIKENLEYPENEKKELIQGKVYTSFIVDANGKVGDIKIIRSVTNHPNFDEAAIKVLNKMPNWSPGKQNNKPVSVQFSMPINFSLP